MTESRLRRRSSRFRRHRRGRRRVFGVAQQTRHGADALSEASPALAEARRPPIAPRAESAPRLLVLLRLLLSRSVPPPSSPGFGPLGLCNLAQFGLFGRDAVFVFGPLAARFVEAGADPEGKGGRDRVELVGFQGAGGEKSRRGRRAEEQVGDELQTEASLTREERRWTHQLFPVCLAHFSNTPSTYTFDGSRELAEPESFDSMRDGPKAKFGRYARERVDFGSVWPGAGSKEGQGIRPV